MRDFNIQTDHVIEALKPDLVLVDKRNSTCKIIDFAVPGNSRIEEKEREDSKESRSKKGITKDLECGSEDYTINCALFRGYIPVW